MTDKIIQLDEADRNELATLYNKMLNTPVVSLTGRAEDSWQEQARKEVCRKLDELGKKYNFNPRKMRGINAKTGEVHI